MKKQENGTQTQKKKKWPTETDLDRTQIFKVADKDV